MNKKILFLVAAFALVATSAKAQDDKYLFNHLGAGISVGTDGIGVELATPCTPYLGIRAGISFIPKINVNDIKFDYSRHGNDGKGKIDASFKKIDGKLLFDVYPFALKNSFHITAGMFAGNNVLATAQIWEDPAVPFDGYVVPEKDNPNNYVLEAGPASAARKSIKARIKYWAVKPYIGIGFGRMFRTPDDSRIGVSCDLGVQFHGTPQVQAYSWEGKKYLDVTAGDVKSLLDEKGSTIDDVYKIKDAIVVYPVLNVRITGRIF